MDNTKKTSPQITKKAYFTVYDMAIVGVMAAVCFVVTYFIKIPIDISPDSHSMIKLANAFCLLAGILFGGLRGGLAAGIGSMLYDLLDPRFITSAPFTLVFFFIMAFVCGKISHMNGKKGQSIAYNILGGIIGEAAYFILHIGKSIIKLMLLGSTFLGAFSTTVLSMGISLLNAVIAVILSSILAPFLYKALYRAGIYKKVQIK